MEVFAAFLHTIKMSKGEDVITVSMEGRLFTVQTANEIGDIVIAGRIGVLEGLFAVKVVDKADLDGSAAENGRHTLISGNGI